MATTPASVDKHPLHPILVAVPIGLWMFSLVCDLMFRVGRGRGIRGRERWEWPTWFSM
jgi:uncharacterized membrane protein